MYTQYLKRYKNIYKLRQTHTNTVFPGVSPTTALHSLQPVASSRGCSPCPAATSNQPHSRAHGPAHGPLAACCLLKGSAYICSMQIAACDRPDR